MDEAQELPEPISGEFLQPKEIMDYVNSLNEAAEFWYYTFYPEKCTSISDEEQLWLDKLNRIGLGYFRPMIAVSLIPRLGYTKEERLAFYKATERFIFINFRMAMYQSSYKSSDYYRKTREVYTGNLTLAEVTDDLNTTTDGNATDAVRVYLTRMNRRFISADGFYSWRDLRYFLYEYEYSLATKYKLEKLSWGLLTKVVKDRITVEHILPQTPTKLYWRNNFRQYNDAEIKLLSSSLGNMLPLSQSINSSLQNDSFDDKKARGYTNGCHCEVEISKEQTWDAQHIYDRGIKLLRFMESRWGFEFESIDQMDELLHIGFVKDGRAIPPEITEETEPASTDEADDVRTHDVATMILKWAKTKESAGEIHIDLDKCSNTYCRFTTDAMTALLPDAPEAKSGWNTKNHYYYEVVNNKRTRVKTGYKGNIIGMQLALSGKNIPADLKEICERINEHYPSKRQYENWYWRVPFSADRVVVPHEMGEDEVFKLLDEQYAKIMAYEKDLLQVMKNE